MMADNAETRDDKARESDTPSETSEKFQDEFHSTGESQSKSSLKSKEPEPKELEFTDPYKSSPSTTTMERGFANRQQGVKELAN